MTSLLRDRRAAHAARVTNIELFFDLVFVLAITQIAHLLSHDLTGRGALQAAVVFLAVWWAWIYTSWVTNWLDPERWAVRVALLVLMLFGLVLSTSIPQAFAGRGLLFALAYVAIQVGRSLFMLWALGDASAANTRNFQRITIWLAATGVLWIGGAFLEGPARLTVWGVAIGLETLAPSTGFAVPRLGHSTTRDWDVAGSHLAERCSLFVIIALGEVVVDTGTALAELEWSTEVALAFFVAFVGSAALWWIYFDMAADAIGEHIATSDDPGRLARLLYTYIHPIIVAGIVVGAVGDELTLAHAGHHPDAAQLAATLGGPALFLIGNLLFKGFARRLVPLSHVVGLALLAGIAALASSLSTPTIVTLDLLATLTLCLVAAWETWSLRRGDGAV